MNLVTTPTSTAARWAAALLRALAFRLDGDLPVQASLAQIAREQTRAAQIALLDNDAEAERYSHTSAMLRERIARLTRVQ